jgi:hypothetical protein
MIASDAKRRLAWTIAAALLTVTAAAPLNACYGKFSLTNKIYDWNGTIGNEFVRSGVMLALVIIPVYELSLLGDAVIFNLIEFWTGSNPIAATEVESNGVRVVTIARGDSVYELRWIGPQSVELSIDGQSVGQATSNAMGDLVVTDADGRATTVFRDELETFRAEVARNELNGIDPTTAGARN